jgi:3-isopropylmalate/(R)-2-methylmalate dehydratase large subunit
MTKAQTLFDKIWARHTILERPDGATLLHVARHLVHDGSRASFGALKDKGLGVRHPERTTHGDLRAISPRDGRRVGG